ncbi:alcohol dehydrogenase catalytic domain-containing protein [Lacticaseibacillus camelliae]|uniref:Alcohol dehydrogenase GroES domain-containing protein n=1 Tax=Lacticaseibacillus camelliae DSM 22697 = JCM 13995 TaxID=1423730 RepID=A0A0R2EQY9_9LACO|nr:zinc-binding dehydrogenase [Lacticaseibacillus camelliae]KRN18680.1 alcohol dehydrogenase GroES domain-containing protein [Lacticaseibacillus camelliae DSM 22697 = JCM 13995]
MKAIVIEQAGGPEALKLMEVPTPQVKPGWSLVKVKGFGINRSEIFTRNGESPTVKFPRILGIECVGEIAATTDDAHLPRGQKVACLMGGMGRAFDGGYAEYVLMPNQSILPVTTSLSWAEFAAIPETYFTAYGALHNAHSDRAKRLLVRGATSGVGSAAIKLAKAMDATIKIAGSTRHQEKFAELKAIGCDEPVLDQAGKVQTNDKFDAIIELVGTATLTDSLAHLNPRGYCCLVGGLANQWTVPDFDPFVIPTGASLTSFGSGAEITPERFSNMMRLIENHHIDVKPRKTFDLAHTGEAQAALDEPDSFGKVVVLL